MMNRKNPSMLNVLSLMVMLISMVMSPLALAQDDDGETRRSTAPSLTTSVAVGVTEAVNLSQEDPPNIDGAIARLNKVISDRGDRLQGYDKATVYEVRGSLKAQKEDLRGSLSDFQVAIDTGALPIERANGLRYYVAQIHFQLENFDAAIVGLREWLRVTEEDPPANAYYLLGLAYVSKEDFRSAQQPMERALQLKGDGDKNYFNVLNLVYSENAENTKRAALLERMINLWPDDASYWQQLTGAYAVENRDREAFSVLDVAYRAGLLTKEDQIVQLIQYYSFFENAYRGAKILEREMAAGIVKRNQDNLLLLSQMWDQSREAKKAIPILEEAARNSSKGDIDFRLGRVQVADEQFAKAERSLASALRKGGLRERDVADIWMLLGNARFSQTGTADLAGLRRAREAFQNATRYSRTRRSATRWVTYINELIRVKEDQDERERLEFEQLCRISLENLKDTKRRLELQGRSLSELPQILQDDLQRCGYDLNGDPIPGGRADTSSQEATAEETAGAEGEGEE